MKAKVTKINGYWQDKDGNRWDVLRFTKKEAEGAGLVDCSDCLDCSGCSDCSYCSDCSRCSYCSNCSDFESQPQQYMTPKMGRDNRINYLHWTKKKAMVTCGCFRGSIDEIEARVKRVHGDNEHGKAYMEQIKIFRYLVNNKDGE